MAFPPVVAASLVVYGIGAIAGSLSGGRFADLWNANAVSIASLAFLAVVLALMGWLFSSQLWIWPLLAVWSFSGYVAFSSYQARLAKRSLTRFFCDFSVQKVRFQV